MSTKFKCIITLFILFVFNDIPIGCQLNEGFTDCFRFCLLQFQTSQALRRNCTSHCKNKNRPTVLEETTTILNQNKVGLQNDSDQNASVKSSSGEESDNNLRQSNPVKFFGSNITNSESFKDDKDKPKPHHPNFTPRNYKTPDKTDNETDDSSTQPTDPKTTTQEPTPNILSQPDHCGFRSTKDISKRRILGGSGMGRIVGGVDADPHEFPWIVSIQYYSNKAKNESSHFCGGAIITKNFILTAAHCMDRFVDKAKSLVIKVGINSVKGKSEQSLNPTKVIVHEGWDKNTQLDDIALIRVEPEIQYTTTEAGKFKVNVLCLPTKSDYPTGEAVLAGWGEQAYKAGVSAEYLQKVNIPFVERSACHDTYKKYLARVSPTSKVVVKESHICAGGKGGEDACRGDSGGPLLQSINRQSFVVGVVSFSVPCAIKDLPTIYTNIFYYMKWIHKMVH